MKSPDKRIERLCLIISNCYNVTSGRKNPQMFWALQQ